MIENLLKCFFIIYPSVAGAAARKNFPKCDACTALPAARPIASSVGIFSTASIFWISLGTTFGNPSAASPSALRSAL